jgi:tryptophan-rich sensory protein
VNGRHGGGRSEAGARPRNRRRARGHFARLFGAVWTPLHASVVWAGGRDLLAARPQERGALAARLGANLAVNTAWNWMFRMRSAKAGLVGTVLLDVSNAALTARAAKADRTAALALVPCAAWCPFATLLNADLARRYMR